MSIGRVEGIFIEIDGGEMVNIKDLSQGDYENFLELVHRLYLSYESILPPEIRAKFPTPKEPIPSLFPGTK